MIQTIKKCAIVMPSLLCALLGRQAAAASLDSSRYQLKPVDATMSAGEYEYACHRNQQKIRKFVTHYSENKLLSLGMSRTSIRVVGALAGAAITQGATLYLNDGKWLALDIKDAGQDDRAILFGIRHKW